MNEILDKILPYEFYSIFEEWSFKKKWFWNVLTFSYSLIPSWLVWAEIKCTVLHCSNQFKTVQQSKVTVLIYKLCSKVWIQMGIWRSKCPSSLSDNFNTVCSSSPCLGCHHIKICHGPNWRYFFIKIFPDLISGRTFKLSPYTNIYSTLFYEIVPNFCHA